MKSIAHCNFVTGENGVTVTDDNLNSVELRIVLTEELSKTLKTGALCLNKKDQSGNVSTVKVFSNMETNEISADLTETDNNYETGTTQYYITTDIAWDGNTEGREMVHYTPFDEMEMFGGFQFKFYKVSDTKIPKENIGGKIIEVTSSADGVKGNITIQTTLRFAGINGFFALDETRFPFILVVEEPSEEYPVSTGTYFATASINGVTAMYVSKYYMDNENEKEIINFNISETLNSVSDNIYVDYVNDIFEIKKATVVKGDCPFDIGDVFITTNSTDPSAKWVGTKWERIAKGRTLVGVDEDDEDFNEVEKTGGSKELQEHNHDHYEWLFNGESTSGVHYGFGHQSNNGALIKQQSYSTSGEVQYGNEPAGTGDSGNLQPYFTCYIWKRTA